MSGQSASLTVPVYRGMQTAKQSFSHAKNTAKGWRRKLKEFIREAFGEFDTHASKLTMNDLINAESAIGATIFGPIPEGHRREFFHHTNNVWIWHESWQEDGVKKETTIRYEVRPDGVYKRPLGSSYIKLEGMELENFRRAAKSYLMLIKQRLY